MTDNIDDLIASLSEEVEPKKPTLPFGKLWLLAALGGAVYFLAALLLFGVREDLWVFLSQSTVRVEMLLLTAILVSGLHATLLSGYPDYRGGKWLLAVPWLLLLCFICFYIALLLVSKTPILWGDFVHGIMCCSYIGLVAIFPAAALVVLLRKFATTHPYVSGATAAMTAFACSALMLRMHESMDWLGHILISHYLPMAFFAIIGAWLGSKLLRW